MNQQEYFRLRAEWLRYRNNVFDVGASLPTLAAALDDTRRLLERRGVLGVLYFDLGSNGYFESIHGWQSYDNLLRAFADALRRLQDGSCLDAADILATLAVRSDKFVVVRGGSGPPLDAEALAACSTQLRRRLQDELAGSASTLMTGLPFSHGHALIDRDPMVRAERIIHRALDRAMLMALREHGRDEETRALGIDAILADGRIATWFQPIVDLRDASVLGHEVFSRGPQGPLADPEALFAAATRAGRLVEVERACRLSALGIARQHLPAGVKLFLNTAPAALLDAEVGGEGFVRHVDAAGLDHASVVLEVSERTRVEDRHTLRTILRGLKTQGFKLAMDDMGAGYSSLQSLVELEPDYLKFDVSLVRGIDVNLIKRSLLETLVELAAKIGADVIAEGIETETELGIVRERGVRFGQGRHLASPSPMPEAALPA